MSKKLNIYMPTEAEDKEINRGIAGDPDTYIPSDEEFAGMKRRGRPRARNTTIQITVRYDQDVVGRSKLAVLAGSR